MLVFRLDYRRICSRGFRLSLNLEFVGCFNTVISADFAFDFTADSSVSFTIIFFDAFPTDYSLVITVNLPKRH